jgi:hypothetical protein
MIKNIFTHRRRLAPRHPSGLADPRPMPRMRWYS